MYPCGLCEEKFASNDDLKEHFNGHESQLLLEVEIKSEQESEQEFDQHSDAGSFILECEIKEEQLEGQKEEIQNGEGLEKFATLASSKKGKRRKYRSKIFKCSECSYNTINKKQFQSHMNLMHLNPFKCYHCRKRFSVVTLFVEHIQKKHMTDGRPLWPEDELIQTSLTDQDNHKGTLYECLMCTIQNRDKLAIYRHIHSVHRKHLDELYKSKPIVNEYARFHKCTKCSYKTAYPTSLRRHMESVHISVVSSKLHKCSICSYETVEKYQLKRHLDVVHHKIRKFTCDLCPAKMSSKDRLQKHIERVHLKENMIYICKSRSNCFFKTSKKIELKRHIQRVHLEIQGFCCEFCGRWYSCSRSFSSHMKKQHPTKEANRWTCDLCQEIFKTRNSIMEHMRIAHMKSVRPITRHFNDSSNHMKEDSNGHESQLFLEVEIKSEKDSDQDSYEGSLVVKEEPLQSQGYEMTTSAPAKVEEERRTLTNRNSSSGRLKVTPGPIIFPSVTFKCSECPFKTINVINFKTHMNILHLDKHKCHLCPLRYPTEALLSKHIEKKHGEVEGLKLPEDVSCRITPEDQIRKSEKPTLCPVNSSSKTFKCSKGPKCSFETASKEKFEYHMNLMHSKRFKCFHCWSNFNVVSTFAAHIQKMHTTDERPLWPEDELIQISLTDQDNQKGILYDCLKCTVQKRDKLAIYQHIHSVHREHLEKLNKSKAIGLKKVHTGVSVPPSNLVPDMPKKSETILVDNARIYYKCTKCSYTTLNKQNLKNHVDTIHHKIRKLTCNLCQMKLVTKYLLQKHIQTIHVNEKMPYICKKSSNCSFTALEKLELTRHIQRVHMKIQGFSCDFCGRWYAFYTSLALHKKTKHPAKEDNRWTCDLCQETFNSRRSIMTHMWIAHLNSGRAITRGINRVIPPSIEFHSC